MQASNHDESNILELTTIFSRVDFWRFHCSAQVSLITFATLQVVLIAFSNYLRVYTILAKINTLENIAQPRMFWPPEIIRYTESAISMWLALSHANSRSVMLFQCSWWLHPQKANSLLKSVRMMQLCCPTLAQFNGEYMYRKPISSCLLSGRIFGAITRTSLKSEWWPYSRYNTKYLSRVKVTVENHFYLLSWDRWAQIIPVIIIIVKFKCGIDAVSVD